MDIITTARHFEMTPEIRNHAHKRLKKLQRYLDGLEDVRVILATEKYRQIAEVSLRAHGTEIVSRGVSDDMITSIDRVVERIERQLQRRNARMRNRKQPRAPRIETGGQEPAQDVAKAQAAAGEDEEEVDLGFEEEEDFSPVVIQGDQFHPEPVSVEKAIEIIRERNEDFLLFTNAQTKKVTLIHMRPDGNFGIVETP